MEKITQSLTPNLPISTAQVKQLVAHPDRDVRAVLAQKICRQIRAASFTKSEQETVANILDFIARDAAAMVRRALAVTLKNSPNLPRDIAKKLIRDVDSVAVPVLSSSPVLTDDDLLEILRSKAAAKMLAITKRPAITGGLVKAIVRYGDSRIVASVAANDGADISADIGALMLEQYHDNDLIKESFIARRDLPPTLIEKLITMVSAGAVQRLSERHDLPKETALDLMTRTRERASVDLISRSWDSDNLSGLINGLSREGRLTNSLIVRAACCGHMQFTTFALAAKTSVSSKKAALMVHDSGPFGLKALCTRAGLSARDFQILRAALVIYADLEIMSAPIPKGHFKRIMLERVLSLPLDFSEEDQEYLLEMLDGLSVS